MTKIDKPPHDPVTILVAEDEDPLREFLVSMLHRLGHAVVEAKDGEAAWDILAGPNPPRLILTDWNMPRLDGLELTKRIRERLTSEYMHVIMFTARTGLAELQTAFEAGVNDFLSKPLRMEELRCRLESGIRTIQVELELARNAQALQEYSTRMEALAEERARELLHVERLATLGSLLSGILHEIRSPLTCIHGYAEILASLSGTFQDAIRSARDAAWAPTTHIDLDDFIAEGPEMILNSTKRIQEIIKDMRSFALRVSQDLQAVSLPGLVTEALSICSHSHRLHVTVTREYDDDLPEVWASPGPLLQVLVNLINNAYDALKGSAHPGITITAGPWVEEGHVWFSVADNGPGIPEEIQAKIFEPFFTTHADESGTGIGLSISRQIITGFGGRLEVESRPGDGARFLLILPTQAMAEDLKEESASDA